jgi:hypothetical protein
VKTVFLLIVGTVFGVFLVFATGMAPMPSGSEEEDCKGGLHEHVSKLYAEGHLPATVKLLEIWDDKPADLKPDNGGAKVVLGCTAKATDSRTQTLNIEYGVKEQHGNRFVFIRWKNA